jgi:hypothetical protein
MKKETTNEGLFGAARKFSDAFFDGLKSNAVNRALKQAEKNPQMPSPIIEKMKAIDKAAKELENMLKELE